MVRSAVQGCRWCCPRQIPRRCAPAATDRLAPKQSARWPAERLRPRQAAEIDGGEVSRPSSQEVPAGPGMLPASLVDAKLPYERLWHQAALVMLWTAPPP